MLSFKSDKIEELGNLLTTHPIYTSIDTLEDAKVFMEHHVFAVWDFMTLLKALQIKMTNVTIPWVPTGDPAVRMMINEIVLGEESDEVVGGLSHFEWYLQAMNECGADTSKIDELVNTVREGGDYHAVIETLPFSIQQFVTTTLEVVEKGELHEIAAAFTIGRENLIPSMFIEFVRNLKNEAPEQTKTLIHYFERHIEVDGDEHGPLALSMLTRLCDNSQKRYEQCLRVSEQVLESRHLLWDGAFSDLLELKGSNKAVSIA
ncbi:DUF3050 domain-containing protein [Pleionea litopenaei]|uniref:DUF3050 domain-containing protein n=1 Tax=Pleionea litopenaei TaxID=3070815 RepID=A0AA51RU70_9GAMM|nr:DUF3050 domain-containing protein [Pleionea sp. HL-JVS1]WMS87590.1 DUF3050 domain-containing protein [Pleionea sp. HL-JVS1]